MLATPDRYLFGFEGDQAMVLAMDRAAYRRSIFLDDRIDPASEQPWHVPVAQLSPVIPAPCMAWIFHMAHCGSTLLARALDRIDGSLVLREPFALRQLAVASANGTVDDGRLALVKTLLARRYDADKMTIVKANVPVNFMLPKLLDADTPAILLYFPLADYLVAVLRSDGHRGWVRRVTTELAPAIVAVAGSLPDSDAERAAALWLAQLRMFAQASATFPRACNLDAELLFATPGPVVAAAAAVFGQPMSPVETDAVVNGPLFSSYAKNPGVAFDNAARLARKSAIETHLRDEVARARDWVAAACEGHPLPDRLDRPLLADAPQRSLVG